MHLCAYSDVKASYQIGGLLYVKHKPQEHIFGDSNDRERIWAWYWCRGAFRRCTQPDFELLIDALDTDLAYIREHTRLLTRAIEWHDNNRRRTNVLRVPELTAAEGWLAIPNIVAV